MISKYQQSGQVDSFWCWGSIGHVCPNQSATSLQKVPDLAWMFTYVWLTRLVRRHGRSSHNIDIYRPQSLQLELSNCCPVRQYRSSVATHLYDALRASRGHRNRLRIAEAFATRLEIISSTRLEKQLIRSSYFPENNCAEYNEWLSPVSPSYLNV